MDMLKGFEGLIKILALCPEESPDPTVNWNAEDQDLEIEWYFGNGRFVQLFLGANFDQGILYIADGDGFDKVDYSAEQLVRYLKRFV